MHVRRFPDAVKEFMFTPLMLALSVMPASWNPFMPAPKSLLTGFTGLAKPGQAILVLGRPGSGCSTFLKTVAGNRSEYLDIHGDIFYSGVEAKKFLKTYKGETVYNPEGTCSFILYPLSSALKEFGYLFLFVFTSRRCSLCHAYRWSDHSICIVYQDTRKAVAQFVQGSIRY